MTEAVFQAPKRRTKVYESFEAPLPVSLSPEDEDHIIYRAEIISQHVIVTNPAHIQHLYGRGYFGKGVFSRSRPEHEISQQWKYVGDRCLPVISSSEYEKRLVWARAALSMQGLEDDSVSRAIQTLTKPVEFDLEEQHRQEIGTSLDQPMDDESHVTDVNLDQREGNPLYDPLAEIDPHETDHREKLSEKRRRTEQIKHSDDYEHVLVEENDDGENDTNSDGLQKPSPLVCRINPFSMMEYLMLSYEEAFFLVYALGCLTVCFGGEPLSISQLWTMFRSLQPNFSTSYAAYHYFRSKGWVPKTGIKYGTDFMLYRKGPPFYHASYSVVVERVDEAFRGSGPVSWRSLAAISRTTANVSKELMLCYVVAPSDLTEAALSSPECLKRFTLQEILVSRWVSSRERTEQDEI